MARKVLLADDSVTAQNMGRKILTDAGYEVVTVNNGSAALKKITEAQPDVIVLDVYMPGYSGLEVCQRIKDASDTAHIPVLLTVGKLEPFKHDEARRVRADAFIIKPFEASELTAALTRLEGKTVTLPKKDGRHSERSTMEGFERTLTSRAPQFGDEESGWKARLKFPSPESNQREPEPEPEAYTSPPSIPFRELLPETASANSQTSTERALMERPIPAGIPQDITPDEIAAITAAAARVKSGTSRKDSESVHADPAAKPEVHAAAVPAAPEMQQTGAAVTPPSSEPPANTMRSVEAQIATAPAETAATTKVEVAPEPVRVEKVTEPPIETFVAATSEAAPALHDSITAVHEPTEQEQPVTIAAIGSAVAEADEPASSRDINRRWVAEEVPLEAEEAVLVLEHEMQKAYAAFAAAEHGAKYESAPIDRNDEPMFATMAPPAIGSPMPMMEGTGDTRSAKEESLAKGAAVSTVHTAETPRFEVPKPPAPPFEPAGANRDEAGYGVAAFGGSPQPGQVAASTSADADELARVQSSAKESGHVVARPESKAAVQQGAVEPCVTEPSRETDLAAATAAAWANWRDVRESVLGPKAASDSGSSSPGTAETELDESKESNKNERAPQPEPDMAAAASVDEAPAADPNLSSIVDNMLAELKPKLMAELAEKLKQEKSKSK